MKFTALDLVKLRWHLLAAIIALVSGIACVLWTQQLHDKAKRDRAQAQTRANQIDSRLKQIKGEEEEIRGKAALFMQLSKVGIIGPEQRLDWTELLATNQREMRLPAMDYEFSPQTTLDSTGTINVGSYVFYRSAMKLHSHLLHEEDLLRFLNALETRARALVIPRSCKLTRLAPGAGERTGTLAQLSADCELDWITVRQLEPK